MTLSEALVRLRESFAPVAGEYALPESERVLTWLLDCSRSHLYTHGNDAVSSAMEQRIDEIIARRSHDEPLAYILGSAYFYDREFTVCPDVLIPRPDTEILVETVLRNERDKTLRFLDLGTGSGCIAAVLLAHNPSWRGIAADISISALRVARRNILCDCAMVCQDRLSAIAERPWFDFLVSNPPYIASPCFPSLPRSVREYEPVCALDGGEDGLDFYRYLAAKGAAHLKAGGRIYCEIGYDQGDSVPALFRDSGWQGVSVSYDLGNRPRVVQAMLPPQRQGATA